MVVSVWWIQTSISVDKEERGVLKSLPFTLCCVMTKLKRDLFKLYNTRKSNYDIILV